MATKEIIKEINVLPITVQWLIVEEILQSIRNSEMAKNAAEWNNIALIGDEMPFDDSPEAIAERKRQLLENNKKYSVNFKEIGYKWNRDEANNYD
ncbi:MAG: hypothetical protein LBN95_00465 [Prevotellaceae bacterium]|jgi:hypothetical protein|nr:hypothetical protein [Prevotellaceae bacterium]